MNSSRSTPRSTLQPLSARPLRPASSDLRVNGVTKLGALTASTKPSASFTKPSTPLKKSIALSSDSQKENAVQPTSQHQQRQQAATKAIEAAQQTIQSLFFNETQPFTIAGSDAGDDDDVDDLSTALNQQWTVQTNGSNNVMTSANQLQPTLSLSPKSSPNSRQQHTSRFNHSSADVFSASTLLSPSASMHSLASPTAAMQRPRTPSKNMKVNNILSYLDQLEATIETQPVVSTSISTNLLRSPRSTQSGSHHSTNHTNQSLPAQPANVTPSFDTIKLKMTTMKSELSQKDQLIQSLQQQLHDQRQHTQTLETSLKQQHDTHMQTATTELQGVIQRHLGFIDTLVHDKKSLTERYETLRQTVKQMESKYEQQLQKLQVEYDNNLQQQTQKLQVQEKQRRQEWEAQRLKAIKQQTIKGLEPEIQKLMNDNKVQIQQVELQWHEQVRKVKEQQRGEIDRHLQEQRQQLHIDNERALEKERTLQQQHQAQLIQRYEQQLSEIRSRSDSELQRQLSQQSDNKRHEQHRIEEAINSYKKQYDESLRTMGDHHQQELEELKRRHATQLQNQQERYSIEREQWQTTMLQRLNAQLHEKQVELQAKLIAERDEELEHVIQRLGDESVAKHTQLMNEYEQQLTDLRRSSAQRYSELQKKYEDCQHQLHMLEATHSTVSSKATVTAAMNVEREQLTKELQQRVLELERQLTSGKHEWMKQTSAEMDVLNQRCTGLTKQLADQQAQLDHHSHEKQVQRSELERHHAKELEALHERVQSLISKKDQQLKEKEEKIAELHRLIHE